MEAGISDHVWSIEELFDLLELTNKQPSDEPSGSYAPSN